MAIKAQVTKHVTLGDDNFNFTGNSGASIIDVTASHGIVDAAGGVDVINVSGSYNTIYAGDGADMLTLASGSHDNAVNGGTGNDYIKGVLTSVDTIDGGDGNDHITVSGGNNNYIDGGAGNDTIYSDHEWSDQLFGGTGNDVLIVNSPGPVGDTGAPPTIQLTGGDGADLFKFTGGPVSAPGGDPGHASVAFTYVWDFNASEDSLSFYTADSTHLAKEDLYVVSSDSNTIIEFTNSGGEPVNSADPVQYVILVGVTADEWAQAQVV